ncbi:hypothetical protein SAMN05660816_05158 [Niastella yeongjuensis]|nr:hypothetical protein SAMN05660816_05158 [Niastella yeongjuensis]
MVEFKGRPVAASEKMAVEMAVETDSGAYLLNFFHPPFTPYLHGISISPFVIY